MKRSAVLWSYDTTREAWCATIKNEKYGHEQRLAITLLCLTAPWLMSKNASLTLEEAQAWCYTVLELE